MPLFGGSVQTRLIKEAKRGELARVKELLTELRAQNGHPNTVDSNGWTALHWATWKGHQDVVQQLVQAPRIDLELRTVDKSRTALYLAAYGGLDRIFSLLLNARARVDTTDYGGYTVLHAAAEAGHHTVVRLLLEHLQRTSAGELVSLLERVDRECGWTALHWAAYQGHTAVVQRLIDYGADVNALDPRRKTPADIACTGERADVHNRHNVVEVLKQPLNTRVSLSALPSSQHLPALPSWGSSFSAAGLATTLAASHHGPHHPGQSAPPSDSASDRHSSGFNFDSPLASPPSNTNGGPAVDPSVTSTSFSGSQHPPSLPPDLPIPPELTTLNTNNLRIPQPLPSTSTSHPSPPHPSSSDPRLHTGPGPSQVQYPLINFRTHSASTGSVNSATAPNPRRTTMMGRRTSDTRQLSDQLSALSRSTSSGSHEGPRAGAGLQQSPRRPSGLYAAGGLLGASAGAGGAGAVLITSTLDVAAAVATCNPGAVIKAIFAIADQLINLCEDAVYCRYKARRLRSRTETLRHCLEALPDRLQEYTGSLQAAYEQTLNGLHDVLNNIYKLVLRFSSRTDNLLGRTMEFLRSVGFREEFEILDAELHSCTSQLMLVMQIVSLAPHEAAAGRLREWHKQNQEDRTKDMQELEQRILEALCGLGRQGVQLEDAVRQLEATLQAHNQDLGQMVSWLEHMNAGHVSLSGHLQRVADRVDEVAVMTSRILAYLQSQRARGPRDAQLPPFLIPSTTIRIDETPEREQWGGCGWVVKAYRDRFGEVAIKIYNINQVGEMDMEAAVREAVKLCRVNHHNVVRCFGILTDETDAMGRKSVSGSLVMEWVEGGDMYRWLQRREALVEVDVGVRMQVMLQVAAGMKHLHQQNLVHGDVKPQNILLQFPDGGYVEDGALLDIVPTVKICDFGLAKYNATTQTTASNWTAARYSPRYTSPERLRTMRRSFEDDVFAFGMLMYFAVTSSDPFPEATDDDLMSGVVRGVRPNIDDWAAQQLGGDWEPLAAKYAQLAKRCWHHSPEQRPNFQEVYAAMEEMLWPAAGPIVP